MSFRKRNIGVAGSRGAPASIQEREQAVERRVSPMRSEEQLAPKGVRPSPVDGSLVTSTGTPSLDSLLAGNAGLVLGNLMLIEEYGTTDYAGTLLRYYAAEGVLQEQHVHVLGVDEHWKRELPGLSGSAKAIESEEMVKMHDQERMKIAWRYERFSDPKSSRGPVSRTSPNEGDEQTRPVFCHAFDLTKRLVLPHPAVIDIIPIRASPPPMSPFKESIDHLSAQLASTSDSTVHRIVVPGILAPGIYPPWSCRPRFVLRFFYALRALLRQYPHRVSAMVSLPITLYPRETGLTRWMELLSDGILELTPFPHTIDTGPFLATSGAATAQEEKPQGLVKIHRLPVFHERGGTVAGSAGAGNDLAFTVTRRRFLIKPFSLPPVEGDTEAQTVDKSTKIDIDF